MTDIPRRETRVPRQGAVLLTIGLAAALALAVLAPEARPQEAGQAHHWPHRTFYIPVNVERINQSENKPTHLQLYSSLNRGQWQAGVKLPLNDLHNLGDGKKGFKFQADRDGDYEFSVQYWYGSDSSPRRVDELSPMLAVVIDTTPPEVKIAANGNGVQWVTRDDNLDSRTIKLEAKMPNWTEWRRVNDREFKSNDGYAWKLNPGQVLEVRVSAKDKAGNEGNSAIVRVPGNEAIGTSFPKLPAGGGLGGDWPPVTNLPRDPVGPAGGNLPRPRIEYVAGKDITVDYTIQKAGRSGVKSASLFVQKDSGSWAFSKKFDIDPPAETGKTLSLKYLAETEGLYGFFVAPESGSGVMANPPRPADMPMLYVVVDGRDPFVEITGVRVLPGGVRGPLVEIAWETADQNLMADPITLEFSVDKTAAQWSEIKYRLPPGVERADDRGQKRYVGTYTWEVPDEKLWKFYVRIRSVDKAGNAGKFVWKNEVVVDLEMPSAGITGVRGGGSAPASPTIPMEKPAEKPAEKPVEKPMPPTGGPKVPELPDNP